MKKLFYILALAALLMALFISPCYAEEGAEISAPSTDTTAEIVDTPIEEDGNAKISDVETDCGAKSAPNTSETLENFAQGEEDAFLDQVIAIVTNGEIWAKIGASVLAVLALLATLKSGLAKITGAIEAVKSFIAGKATKEETEAAIGSAMSELKKTYENEFSKMSDKYSELEAKYDQQTAILSLLSLQLVKSPNARVQIMELIGKAKDIGGNVAEVVANIEAEIEAADAAEPKQETPALDAIKASITAAVSGATAEQTSEKETTAYIALG